jgi:hypothetical protein
VEKANLRNSHIRHSPLRDIADGEVLIAVDRFALTSNNVSYALTGDYIGYWKFFPTGDDSLGSVPVWGFGDVVQSRHPDVPVGERLYGYFPMASHVIFTAGRVTRTTLLDAAEHRSSLPPLYNRYVRTGVEPDASSQQENLRALLYPLFATSYVLHDFFHDNDFFGAGQLVIGSASSKTGLGLAAMMKRGNPKSITVTGLTSAGNRQFVEDTGYCDVVLTYDRVGELDATIPAVLCDMSGASSVITAVHNHFGDDLRYSCIVGATHWDAGRQKAKLRGAKPTLFFAPSQIEKRNEEWGPGVVRDRAAEACKHVMDDCGRWLTVSHACGAEAAARTWSELLAGNVPPNEGRMHSIRAGA